MMRAPRWPGVDYNTSRHEAMPGTPPLEHPQYTPPTQLLGSGEH